MPFPGHTCLFPVLLTTIRKLKPFHNKGPTKDKIQKISSKGKFCCFKRYRFLHSAFLSDLFQNLLRYFSPFSVRHVQKELATDTIIENSSTLSIVRVKFPPSVFIFELKVINMYVQFPLMAVTGVNGARYLPICVKGMRGQ